MGVGNIYKIPALMAVLLFCISANYSQIIGSNLFLKGQFVEVGINQCGAFGSGSLPPAADDFHANPGLTGLGFVADWESDGWDTGTPDYCGDYFVPGTPVEGWQVQIGATTWINTDQNCFPDEIPGDVAEYSYSGGVYTGTWEGSIASADLSITQITTLPEDKLYFVTRILFCNDGDEPLEDVYYMRNVDPDNDQPWSGDFTTDNEIVYQPPADEQALVASEGLTYGCFLGLGARDTLARVSYGNFGTGDGDPEDVWNGTGGYESSGSEVGDIATSIAFYIPVINPGECKCVAFAYILNISDLEEALEATVTYNLTANDVSVASGGSYTICNPGDPVTLEVLGADDYLWTWTPSEHLNIDTGISVIATVDETTTFTAVGVGGFCGDATINVTIYVDNDEFSDAGLDEDICIGSSTTLNGNGGSAEDIYLWSPSLGLSDPNIANPVASPTTTTAYTLTTYDTLGCPAYSAVLVTVNPLPNINAGANEAICVDGQIELEATGGVSYVWTPAIGLSNPNIANPICTVDDETIYTVTGTDVNGCVNTDEMTVTVNYLPEVTATASPYTIDVFLDETTQLDVTTGGVIFSWSPVDGLSDPNIQSPIAQPQDTLIYTVTVTDAQGCVNTDTVVVYVIGELNVLLPNAFSPNGDGVNDYYYPAVSGSGDLEYYAIYNRWGEILFENSAPNTADGSNGWDGTWNGKEAEVGSYVVIARAKKSFDDAVQSINGTFVLIR